MREEKSAVEKERDFLQNEQNTKELQLSDIRSKLKKRSEELAALKDGLNSQIRQVHETFEEEEKSQTRTIELLRASLAEKETELAASKELAETKIIEANEATDKLNRQREVLRSNG